MTQYSIIEYCEEMEGQLQSLERASSQGKRVSLEIMMSNTLDRTKVFDQFKVYVATVDKEIAGVIHAAKSWLSIDEQQITAGIPMNLRIHDKYRGKGIAKALVSYANENFFKPLSIDTLFTTTKRSNIAVLAIAKVLQRPVFKFSFEYLTVPSYARINKQFPTGMKDNLQVLVPRDVSIDNKYSVPVGEGVGIWRTDLMYSLRIAHLAPGARLALVTANIFRPYGKKFPQINSELNFCTLYGLTQSNMHMINNALHQAQSQDIRYVNVCCTRNGSIYKALRRKAINIYPYLLLSTHEVNENSQVKIDVRCL